MENLSAICVTFLAFFVGYVFWIQHYWKLKNIKGPIGLPFIGSFHKVADVNVPRCFVLNKWTQKFGKVFGYMEGSVPVLVISDLAMLKELFVDKFDNFYARKLTNMLHGDMESSIEEPIVNLFVARGARWKRLRALASPVFTPTGLRKVHLVVEDSVRSLMDCLATHDTSASLNIHEYFQEYTYDVISRLAMGQPNSELFNNAGIKITKAVFMRTHKVLPWYLAVTFPKFQYYIKKLFINHENVRGGDIGKIFMFCANAVKSRLQEREENKKLGIENAENDFIDMFLNYYSEQVQDVEYGTTVERKVTAEDVVGACFVFLLAGFDTTANTLAFASYLLAKNPNAMKKAQEEIDDVLGSSDNVDYDATTKLKYLDAVVKEALRLYSVGWFACSRECVTPTTLGGIEIEKGVQVEVDVMAIHKDKIIWGEDADELVPERWLNNAPTQSMSFIPFGAGPRKCVGEKLGRTEALTALTYLLRKYDLKTGPDTEERLELLGCTTTSPKSVTLYLSPRP